MREPNQDQNHHDSLEDDSEFCDKKLLAINHLYNNSSEAILSVRGTVRGIRNRVRAGIKTFAPEKVTLAAIMVITVKPKWTSLLDHLLCCLEIEKELSSRTKANGFLTEPINPDFQIRKYFDWIISMLPRERIAFKDFLRLTQSILISVNNE